MKLFAKKTEEISVDASEIQEQLNNLSKRIDSLKQSPASSSADLSSFTDMLHKLDNELKEIKNDTTTDKSINDITKDLKNIKNQLTTIQSSSNVNSPISSPNLKFEFVWDE